MEQNQSNISSKPEPQHSLTLVDRKHLNMTGIAKVVSIKPDIVQLKSSSGDIIITGQNIEVTKLDLEQHTLNLSGKFDNIKYLSNNKTPLFKKIFK